jgi:HEAT repeat protein
VIFAFDELTEMREISEQIQQAVPVLKQLLKDKNGVVRGMAEEVIGQIEGYQKNKAKKKNE